MSDRVDQLEAQLVRLERRLQRQQRIAGIALALLCAVLAMATLQAQTGRQRITELDVERLNVVEPDGQLVMSLANTTRLPDPLLGGKTLETGRNGPGIIFFDGKGWEVGGLTYGTRANGGATGHFSFDQFHNDQVVYMQYDDNGSTNKRAGLFVMDRARTPTLDEIVRLRGEQASASAERKAAIDAQLRGTAAQRVFVGAENETAMVRLRDRQGRERIRLAVDQQGAARLEFLDAAGAVVERLPK
jgi:catechol 2,3-dioxygenase-like lactoylglutathione lyase family enzyme